MYNTINHFAEPGFKAQAMAEFFTSRANTAEQLLALMYDAVDSDMDEAEFLTMVENVHHFSRNALIIVDSGAVRLDDVLINIHSTTRDEIRQTINWAEVEVLSTDNKYVSVARVIEKLTALVREGYISAAGFTVISQEGTIADFRDLLSERIASAYEDVTGQLSYWASLIRSKLDKDALVERALSDMTPEDTDGDHSKPPLFNVTPYSMLSDASPAELAGLDLSLDGVIPSAVSAIFEAYFTANFWLLNAVIKGVTAVSRKVASGFLPYEAVIFGEGKAGTFKYGAWTNEKTVSRTTIPRTDDKWQSINFNRPIEVDETMAMDLSFGQLLFQCSGTTEEMHVTSFFKPKVIIPHSKSVIWGSRADGSFVYPADPIKMLSSISNDQAYKALKYSSLLACAVSQMCVQELTQVARPSGSLTLLTDQVSGTSAEDLAHLLGDESVAVDFIQGQPLASAMMSMLDNYSVVIASFLIEKAFYPVDYEFMAFTSSMIGWDEYSYDLTTEEDARAQTIRKTTNAFLAAAAVAVSVKYGPKLVKALTNLYSRSLVRSYSAMAKAASGSSLSRADVIAIRRAGSRISLMNPAAGLSSIKLGLDLDNENEYSRLYSLIAGVYP